jgi:hypothetical protein
LFSQDTLQFNIKLSQDTIFSFEIFELSANIKNISNEPIRIILPWYDGSNHFTMARPYLQIKTMKDSTWHLIKYSDYDGYGGNREIAYSDLACSEILPQKVKDKNLLYSPFTCENSNKVQFDGSLYQPIFSKIGHYKIRLCFYNQEFGLDGYNSNWSKSPNEKLIYSNELDIFIKKIPKKEKKAINWLKKQKNCLSLIYSPTIHEPFVLEKHFTISQLEEFIRLFPKSMFIPYAKIQLADLLRKDYKKEKTIEDYEKIIELINFSTSDKKILKQQEEIRAKCKYYQNYIKNKEKK